MRIGFIGLGNMGGPMAFNVLAQASEVVFTSLPGPREVEAVALGAGGILEAELGREFHVPMLIAALAEQQLEEALRRGWGDRDSNALFCLQEERAGVQLRTGGR